MRSLPCGLVLAIGLVLGGWSRAQDAKQDMDKLEGTWMVLEAELNEAKTDAEKAKEFKLTFKSGTLTIRNKEGSKSATFELDPTKKPSAIDLTPEDGKDKGKAFPGIYALEGNRLKLCFREKGTERPTAFATTPDSGLVLFVLQKAK